MKSNLIIFGGIVLMVLAMLFSKYLYQKPAATFVSESDVTYSSDGLASVSVKNTSGVRIEPITPWQVIPADVLAGTFVAGYDVTDPSRALTVPVSVEIRFLTPLRQVPVLFKTVEGLTTQVEGVVYTYDGPSIVAASFLLTGAARVYALDHYKYRNSKPVISVYMPERVRTKVGEQLQGQVTLSLNDSYAIFGQDKGREKAHLLTPGKISGRIDYYTSVTDVPLETTEFLFDTENRSFVVQLAPMMAACNVPGPLHIDAMITLTYEAGLYEREVFDWLYEPTNETSPWKEIVGAVQNHTESFYIRQPFECVAE